jgi:hypothetical protein
VISGQVLLVTALLLAGGAREGVAQDSAAARQRALERAAERAAEAAVAARQAGNAVRAESLTSEAARHATEAARHALEAAGIGENARQRAREALQGVADGTRSELLAKDWALLGDDPQGVELPDFDEAHKGDRAVPAGETVRGTIATAGGNLDVFGRVVGDAVAVHGDVILHPGSVVDGNALAVAGEVRFAGGTLTGEARTLSAAASDAAVGEPRSAVATTWGALRLALGWAAMIGVLGIAVLIFAEQHLDGVHATLQRRFWRSFWVGALGQVALLPVLVLVIAALAVTIVGILVIPLAAAAYVLAVAGLVALGFLAVARVVGASVRAPRGGERYVALRSLTWGLTVFSVLWLLAAAFTAVPVASTVLRLCAAALTWAAMTAGFGAALISRAGTRPAGSLTPAPAEELAWQTPTPVTGVAAARRPTPSAPPPPVRPR